MTRPLSCHIFKNMKLSIIISHYQTLPVLKLCLKYLQENLPTDWEKEIIIADSEARSETQEAINQQFPSVILIPFKENAGFGKAVNAGLKKAQGKYILVLNADIIIHKKETLPLMLEYLVNHPDVGIIGPQLLNFDGSPQNSCFKFYTPLVVICRRTILGKTSWGKRIINNFLMRDVNKNQPIEVDWLMGSSLLTRKSTLKKVGLFDERFFMYFEDVDWCHRFWQAGYKVVYFPLARMYHYHMQASKKGRGIFDIFISKYTRIHLASALKYFLKWGGGGGKRN